MKTATVDQVMAWGPCYERQRVEQLWGKRKRLTFGQIAALDIPLADRLWALPRMMNRRQAVAYACDCAARSLKHWRARHHNDKRPQIAIATTRRWLDGKATMAEVRDASAAAYAAAASASASAASADAYAAYDAAYASAYASASAAAREKEQRWQLRRAVAYLTGKVGQ